MPHPNDPTAAAVRTSLDALGAMLDVPRYEDADWWEAWGAALQGVLDTTLALRPPDHHIERVQGAMEAHRRPRPEPPAPPGRGKA
jgi:hypothetical protein